MTDDHLDQQVHEFLKANRRSDRWAWAIVGVVLALIAGSGVGAFAYVNGNQQEDAKGGQATRDRVTVLEANYAKLYAQFQKCKDEKPDATGCKEPVVPPVEDVKPKTTSPTASTPTLVVEQLSPTAIATAFARYCAVNDRCDGKRPTRAELSAAVATYCNARGECIGKDGESVKGDKGDPGEPAPPPSDAQVLAGVAAYCEQNGQCQGDPAPACPDGYHGEAIEVLTSLTESEQIFACVVSAAH